MFAALFSSAVRLLFTLATVFFVLMLMGIALVSLLAFALWSLLRGRRPVFDFSGLQRARQFRAGTRSARPARPAESDIVDVEVREVRSAAPRLE